MPFMTGNFPRITVAQTWSAIQTFTADITITDANIILSTNTGTEIGTASNQLLSFYGATPIDQEAHIADPSGGATIDAEARTAINAILADLASYGLQAAS